MIRSGGAAMVLVLAACEVGPPGPGVDVDRVMSHVAVLSQEIGERPAESTQSLRAADWIERELRAIGATVERLDVGTIVVPEIAVGPFTFMPRRVTETTDDNLLARFGPRDGAPVLVMAHYDTVPGSPGAIDNAVAVGIVIEVARDLARAPPSTPVWLAFTAREEGGLVGARRMAAEFGDRVAIAISLDLIGGDGPLVVNGASTLIGRAELDWIAGAADTAGVALDVPLAYRVVSRWWPQIERSDHGPFTQRGARAIHLMNRGAGGERIFVGYHTPRDTIANVSRRAADETGRLVVALARTPPPPRGDADGDAVWLPVPGNIVVPRWSVLAACWLLAVAAIAGLVRARRSHAPVAGRGPGLAIGAIVYLAAAAIAFAIEVATRGDHPSPWAHAPLRTTIAGALVLAGGVVLATSIIARSRRWIGLARWAIAGAILDLIVGAFAVVVGAAELAWMWLVPAAALAWLPRAPIAVAIPLAAIAIAPTALLCDPDLLRELMFHGFYPLGVPLAAWVALHAPTPVLAIASLVARVPRWGPGAVLVVPAAAVVAFAIGIAVVATTPETCAPEAFLRERMACEGAAGGGESGSH